MENTICKIVYFDEDSVTDYVQIIAGGELERTTQLLKESERNVDSDASLSGKAGIRGVFKALLGCMALMEQVSQQYAKPYLPKQVVMRKNG